MPTLTSSITVSIVCTNDAATITLATTTLTETNAAFTTSTMVISDVDSATTTALTAVAGSNSYRLFSMTTAGEWTPHRPNNAQNQFAPAPPTPMQ
ncbi:MAG: hypothetical protein IPO38_08675 [Rhodocyclaceae bacterium]|nr:hypothetical protein [Rhodocyclaceae bacterium]